MLVFLIKALKCQKQISSRAQTCRMCVVEKGNGKKRILTVCRENAKRDGASWWQCLPGIGTGTALVETWVLHVFQLFLPHCVHPHHVHCLHCNSESFPFTASCFFRSFGEIHSWELLEMCVTKFDLFIRFYLLLIEQKQVHEGSW